MPEGTSTVSVPIPKEQSYKEQIRTYIDSVIEGFYLPEFPYSKKGKVREIYMTDKYVIMVATDRVSAFDNVLDRCIPFKGYILNMLTRHSFLYSKDVVPNALVESKCNHPNIIVQKRMRNLNVEFILRRYLWGSMASAYEAGERVFCGIPLDNSLLRYQKLNEIVFTPTTKGDEHDENLSLRSVEQLVGKDICAKAIKMAMKLFEKGTEAAKEKGMLLIDSKYEFGVDEENNVCVIDEVNTPDSSRLVDAKEWTTKFEEIKVHMSIDKYKTVNQLLIEKPNLKIKEHSKQYVRDVLIERGFKPGGQMPRLSDEEVVECSYRYISVYEQMTGETFVFPRLENYANPKRDLLASMCLSGLIRGACIIVMAGSNSDIDHIKQLKKSAGVYNLPIVIRVCSAHKQPHRLERLIRQYNTSVEPLVIIAVAGLTDALSGTVSFSSVYPVVSCPPDAPNQTCITNPPLSSNAYVTRPDNAIRFAAQALSHYTPDLQAILSDQVKTKVNQLVECDATINALLDDAVLKKKDSREKLN